jgi:hypothetical protein
MASPLGLPALPTTVAFFKLPRRSSVGFVLDFGAPEVVLQGLEEGSTPEEQLLTVKRATWAISI